MQEQIQNWLTVFEKISEYFLREELKHIQQELGISDPRSATYNKLAKQIAAPTFEKF